MKRSKTVLLIALSVALQLFGVAAIYAGCATAWCGVTKSHSYPCHRAKVQNGKCQSGEPLISLNCSPQNSESDCADCTCRVVSSESCACQQ